MELIKILREPCYLKPFITLNVLFLLMTFSGKFAVEMYALDILERTKTSLGQLSAIILLGWVGNLGSNYNLTCNRNHCRDCQPPGLSSLPSCGKTGGQKEHPDRFLSYHEPRTGCSWWASHSWLPSTKTLQIPASNCQTNEEAGENSWISLICILIYMLSAPIGLCSIPFMYIAELYPPEVMSISPQNKVTSIIFYLDAEFDGRSHYRNLQPGAVRCHQNLPRPGELYPQHRSVLSLLRFLYGSRTVGVPGSRQSTWPIIMCYFW